jgi:hypothetical protein
VRFRTAVGEVATSRELPLKAQTVAFWSRHRPEEKRDIGLIPFFFACRESRAGSRFVLFHVINRGS